MPLLQNPVRSVLLALSWLTLMTVLFCLPGSALPKSNFFTEIHIDKWVHVGLFLVLYLLLRAALSWKLNSYAIAVLLFCVLYGVLIEYIQEWFISNRNFDLYDILADTAGAVLGWFVWLRVYKKNKPL